MNIFHKKVPKQETCGQPLESQYMPFIKQFGKAPLYERKKLFEYMVVLCLTV